MFIESNKVKIIKQSKALLSKHIHLLLIMFVFTMWNTKAIAQNQSVLLRKDSNVFSSYVFLLEQTEKQKKEAIDSLRISIPFQNIHSINYSIVNGELFIVYESNGANRITKGKTVTLLRYNLDKDKFRLTDSVTIAKGANNGIRGVSFTLEKEYLKLKYKNQQERMYNVFSNETYLSLANKIIKDFSNL